MIHHFVSVQSISVALCNYREIVNSYKKARAFLPTTNCEKGNNDIKNRTR